VEVTVTLFDCVVVPDVEVVGELELVCDKVALDEPERDGVGVGVPDEEIVMVPDEEVDGVFDPD